jgi:transcriptional regulator with XRE-family HTH domain
MDASILPQRFGEKLRILRTKHTMTVRELAEALGYVSYSHISGIEVGKKKPSLEFAVKVSRLFGVSTDQLVKDELELDDG